jgi:hypothetical protein
MDVHAPWRISAVWPDSGHGCNARWVNGDGLTQREKGKHEISLRQRQGG